MPDPSDDDLLRRFNAGDESAFTLLVDRHADLVYRTCMRLLLGSAAAAEDAAQVVFLVAARKAARLDGRGGLGPWFYRTAVMVSRNARRGEERRSRREARETFAMTIETAETPWNEAKPLLDEAIQSLGRKQREAVVLHYLQGITQVETGRQLGCSESAVRQRLEGALAQLRRFLSARQIEITSAGLVANLGRDLAMTCPQALRTHCLLAQGGVHALPAASAKVLAAQVLSPVAGVVTAGAVTMLAAGLMTVGILGGMRAPPPAVVPALVASASPAAPSPPPPSPPQVMGPLSSISGILIDAKTQQPVVGVDVMVKQARGATLPTLPGAKTVYGCPLATSDAHGRYQVQFLITVPDLQEVEVYPVSGGYSFGSSAIMIYRGESVESEPLRLTKEITVQGRITDVQGHAIAHARLYDFSRCLFTDANGIFTDSQATASRPFYDVVAPGYRQARITLQNGSPDQPMSSFPLSPGPSVSGRVALPQGVSTDGLEVAAGYFPSLNALPVWRTPVDRQGNFTLLTAPSVDAEWWLWVVRGSEMAGRPLKMTPGLDSVLLPVYQTGTIRCEVRDGSGARVVGARVSARRKTPEQPEEGNSARSAVTDVQGMATLAWVPAGAMQVQVDWIDSQSSIRMLMPQQAVEVHAGETLTLGQPLTILPAPAEAPRVQGILRDAHGHPALHVLVGVVLLRSGQPREKLYRGQAYTQDDGRFVMEMPYDSGERSMLRSFEPPPPAHADQVRVVAGLDGFTQDILDVTRGYPPAANDQDLGVITLALPRPRSITVSAHRAEGGVPVVTIDSCRDGAGRDVPMRRRDGYWSSLKDPMRHLDILQEGPVTIEVHDDVGNRVKLPIPAGEDAVTMQVDFPLARRVHFTVRDERDKPVLSLNWFGHPLAPPWSIPPETGSGIWCDAQGVIDQELAVQAEGTYLFFLDLHHEVVTGSISPGSTPIIRQVRFISSLGHLHGHVRDADGRPAAKANVTVVLSSSQGFGIQASLTPDADGAFDTTLPSGITATVTASTLGGMDSQQGSSGPLEVKPGVTTEVEVLMHPLFPNMHSGPAIVAPPPAPARPPPKGF